MPVLAIASLDDLLAYLSAGDASDAPHRERVAAYRARYGEA